MRGRPGEAIACYRRTIELAPGRADANFNLAVALEGQGQLDQAIARYRRTVELEPDNAPAREALRRAQRRR
jgi:tetratricopeptide (TPR) repeat protein